MAELTEPKTILIIEDDPSLALGLCDALEFEGFQVKHCASGEQGVSEAGSLRPDCIILDLMLPDLNGYQVCERIRKSNDRTPILMLTARSQEADKIRGLDAGADDYVTKPFSIGELVARLRAIFRRTAPSQEPAPTFEVGTATVDPRAHTLVNGQENHVLSFYEAELLKLLHAHAGEPVSRDEILRKVWGIQPCQSNRTVDNFIVKLRKKVEPSPEQPRHILTVYGMGYKLVP